jgi:Cu2+-exporting ATPase
MMSGDNEATVRSIACQAGIELYYAGVTPQEKEEMVRRLQTEGCCVAMVGDGINDAPALVRADVGIAIGAGTDVAIDSADVVLMNSRLTDVAAAVRLSRATLRNIHQNLFWAFFYNLICIPLAAGLFVWKMNPMVGAAAMSLSSFTVCTNALRLNLFKLYDASHDLPAGRSTAPDVEDENAGDDVCVCSTDPGESADCPLSEGQQEPLEWTVHVDGMMCPHCERQVQEALEALDGVIRVKASHELGTAVVTLSEPVPEEAVCAAIEGQDYEYISIERSKTMKKTVKIEGMMCMHCAANVKKALEALEGVDSAEVSHEAGTAVVSLSGAVEDTALQKAVEDKGYKFLGVEG